MTVSFEMELGKGQIATKADKKNKKRERKEYKPKVSDVQYPENCKQGEEIDETPGKCDGEGKKLKHKNQRSIENKDPEKRETGFAIGDMENNQRTTHHDKKHRKKKKHESNENSFQGKTMDVPSADGASPPIGDCENNQSKIQKKERKKNKAVINEEKIDPKTVHLEKKEEKIDPIIVHLDKQAGKTMDDQCKIRKQKKKKKKAVINDKKIDPATVHHDKKDGTLLKVPSTHLKDKLLVLDLNGLLCHIVFPRPKHVQADAYIYGSAIFQRPFYEDFLKFCFANFEVAIWSSRKKKKLDNFLNHLMGDLKRKLIFCWDASYCTTSKLKSPKKKYRNLAFKDLNKIWNKCDPRLPWKKGYFNSSNTLLIDDSPCKSILNPPFTAIFPKEYHFSDANDNSLGDGGELRMYLQKLVKETDVAKFVAENPFGQPPISESSEDWQFYSNAASSLLG